MISLKKSIAFLLLVFPLSKTYCQENLHSSSPISIQEITLDTVKVNLNSIVVNKLWLSDTIRVRVQNDHLVLDPDLVKALRMTDSTALTKHEDIDKFFQLRKVGAQNCYSYALEKYFQYNDSFSQTTFGKSTDLDRKSAEKILNNNFEEITELSVSRKRNLKNIPDRTLLAFINDNGWAIHFVYYHDDIFYSKNGAHKPMEFKSLRKFLKNHYQDTRKVIAYKVDENKVNQVYHNNDKQQSEL